MLHRIIEAVLPVLEVMEVIAVNVDNQVIQLNPVVAVKQIMQDNKIMVVAVGQAVDVAVNRGVSQAVAVGINHHLGQQIYPRQVRRPRPLRCQQPSQRKHLHWYRR